MAFLGVDGTPSIKMMVPPRRKRWVNKRDVIDTEEKSGGYDNMVSKQKNRPSKSIEEYYDEQGLKDNIQTINEIGENKLGEKIKKQWNGNLKGALYGGGFGVVVALATRKNPYVFGIVGLIIGRVLFKKEKK
jgi:hypothetical protein